MPLAQALTDAWDGAQNFQTRFGGGLGQRDTGRCVVSHDRRIGIGEDSWWTRHIGAIM